MKYNILLEIENLIDANAALFRHNKISTLINATGSVISALVSMTLSPIVPLIVTVPTTSILLKNVTSAINDHRFLKLLDGLLFRNHASFISQYYSRLSKYNVKGSAELNTALSKCLTQTSLFSNIDEQVREMRSCYLKFLEVKSQLCEIDKNDPDYIKLQNIKKDLPPLNETITCPIGGGYPVQMDFIGKAQKINRNYLGRFSTKKILGDKK
jgi:hypothetical protein